MSTSGEPKYRLSGRRRSNRSLETGDGWWRANATIRFYGIVFLAGTKLADIVTTAVGVRYVPTIAEANPFADWVFMEWGLFTGLTVLGFVAVLFAICAAELFAIEVRRRLALSKIALFAQASIYLTLSTLFGVVAVGNGLLIADQVIYMLGDLLVTSGG